MDESLHAHLRQPILKILHSHGITRASSVSLQVLSSLLDKYMKDVLLSCQEYANHAGRNGLRVQDMMQSLEEMGCTSEDLEDYLQIEGGVRTEKEKSTYNNEEVMGLHRYANVVGPRKEAELNEFKGKYSIFT
jgi:histone H3/H4